MNAAVALPRRRSHLLEGALILFSFANRTAQALLNSLFGKTSNFGALASAPTIYVSRMASFLAWDGVLSPTELDAIYQSTRARFGV